MKKVFITIIAMLMPMLAMGQILLYEQDFTGITEFTGWSQFDDSQTDGRVEVVPDGVAITVGIQTGQLWQPQVMVIPDGSFNLWENANYRVIVTAKFPTSGTLQMNMGTWSANDQARFYVPATGGFQTVVCDFMNWSVDATGAHLLFQCGDFKGTTILKKIQILKLESGLNYNFNSVNKTAEVIPHAEGKYYGTVEIPSKVIRSGVEYSVTSIGSSAFEGCVYVTSVTIPSSVTTIGGAAFYYCTGLKTVDIPNGVKTLGEGAFSKCGGLASVTIPGSVTSIGKNAFFQCYGLTQITSGIENPFAIDDGVFPSSVYTNASLLVPSGRKAAYQNTAGWKRFQNIIEPGVVVKEFEVNGIRYLIGENNTVSVISKTEKYAGAVSIPNQVSFNGNNYTVTSIGSSAFEGCTGLTSVTIPSSVTTIGGAAFYMCTGLTNIDIPNGVKTLGEGAFSKCGGLTSVTIPGSVTSIGKNAFFQCYGLTQVTSWIENPFAIDDGVFPTSVYNNASLLVPSGKKSAYQNTAGWKRFQNIIEPSVVGKEFEVDGIRYKIGENNTVSVVNREAKYSYSGDVVIPEQVTYNGATYSVTTIGFFGYCTGLLSVTIPPSIKSIAFDAFDECINLTAVNITDIASWCNISFASNYSNPLSKAHHLFLNGKEVTDLVIPNSVTTIKDYSFLGCSGLTSITIPNSVTKIGFGAFGWCSGLTTIVSEIANPFAIDDGFDKDIYATATLVVPTGKKSAYQNAAGWNKFTNIVEIGQGGIIGCEFEDNGIYYRIGKNNTVSVISGEAKYSGDIVIPNQVIFNGVSYSVTEIWYPSFRDCTGLTSITLPPSLTRIGEDAFKNCTGLTAVHISDLEAWLKVEISVGSTDDGIDCSSSPLFYAHHLYLNGEEVKSIEIPNNMTVIPDCHFENWSGLTSVTIPNSITHIGYLAFSGCTGLTSITIPNSVISIGWMAFQGCNLNTIYSGIENPFVIGDNVFGYNGKDIYSTATLIVPPGKKSAYQNTAGWNKFQNIVEANGGGKEFDANDIRYLIGENNTVSVTSKTEKYAGAVSIPSQVYYDGNNYTVTAIAQSAFEGCVDMTSVTIPSSVTTIGGAAFYYCTGLKTVDIPNGVKTIGEGAFSKCEGLTSVTIPGSVTSIGKNAFFQCYGLTQITSWIENPFAIDDGVFPTSVYNSASLFIPSGKKTAYQNTAGWKRFQNITEASAVGKEFEANGVRYLIGENNTVSVISKTEKYAGAVSIPNQVSFNGNNYNVTSIAQSAFEGCVDMTSVSIPGSVTTIGGAAFYYCTGLTTVDIPNGVKTIGEGAFSKCEGLTSVTIPGSVMSIGKNAFFQCYGLTQITSWIENPFAIDDGVFPTSVYNNASLFVPSGKKSAYQNTAGWKRFQNIYYADGIYTLTYYVDGVEYKSVTYSYGAGITPEPAPTKEGYTFSGWIDLPETMPNHDVTVTGTFTLNKYKLTYKIDGEVYQTYLLEYGATITPEAEPTKEGYTFSGWSYIPEKMPADEVTIVGSFTINQYTITYMIDGEKYASETVDYNSKIVPPTPPSKDGFDFAWEEYPETMPAHDITINGAYTTTGILSIAIESGKAKIFTLDGRQVDTPQKGINIIRMDDGTIKKVVLSK